jgi:hypothetical protein
MSVIHFQGLAEMMYDQGQKLARLPPHRPRIPGRFQKRRSQERRGKYWTAEKEHALKHSKLKLFHLHRDLNNLGHATTTKVDILKNSK